MVVSVSSDNLIVLMLKMLGSDAAPATRNSRSGRKNMND